MKKGNWKNQYSQCLDYTKHICAACDSDKTTIEKDGHEHWRYHDGYWMCKNCYSRYVLNPISIAKHMPRQLVFMGKRIYLNENPRKGICQWCNKKVGDEYINCRGKLATVKTTLIHHIQYHPEDPLKDTIEICAPCHNKYHRNLAHSIN